MPLRQVQAMSKSRVVPEGTTKRYREGNFHTSYTTLNELGRGRFAVVRKCKHKDSNQHFAAKFVRKRKMGRDLREDILKEIRILEDAFTNQRLIGLHEVYETSTEVILVLEYALGGELHQYCVVDKEDAFSERDVVRLLKQILEGVHYLHKQNIAHLDLKPQNILLTSPEPGQGDVRLIDFGIARYLHQGEEIRDIQGTPDYVAPEILNYEPITLATDMWSVGVLTYVMLSGVSPFAGDTKQETFLNISQVNLDFADEDFECHSPEAQDFIRKLCIKESEKRLTAEDCLKHPWILKFTSLELDANDNVTQNEKSEVSTITVDLVICRCERGTISSNELACIMCKQELDLVPSLEELCGNTTNCLDNRIPTICDLPPPIDEKTDNERVVGPSADDIIRPRSDASIDETMSDVDVHMECESKDEQTDSNVTSEPILTSGTVVVERSERIRSQDQRSEDAEIVVKELPRRKSITYISTAKVEVSTVHLTLERVESTRSPAGNMSGKSPQLICLPERSAHHKQEAALHHQREIERRTEFELHTQTESHSETKCVTCNRLHPEGPGEERASRSPHPSPSSSPMGTRRAFCPNKENSPGEIHEPKRFCLQVLAQQPEQVCC